MESKRTKTIRLAQQARKNLQRMVKGEIRIRLQMIAIELYLHPDFDFDNFDFNLSRVFKNHTYTENEKAYVFMIIGHIRDFWNE